jgi:serine/threonine protein kinase
VPDVMKTVGRYEILREVGRGGMAMVYLARQTDLDRFVALKELAAFHASDASFAHRFLRESRVAGSLSHPNIVTVHDYFEHDGTPYIAMEYVERGSLRPYVGRMTLAQVSGVLEGLLAGLAHAEQQGIVHRDLKPENLMVTADGRVKIADFGIAKATTKMQTGAFLTATGTTVGTPTYMAPEQAMAQDIGPWTDLYSVGCMAFEMFTGRVPFHDSDAPMAILLRHVNEPIPTVKSIEPSVDQRVSDWIETLLVKDPKQRAQSANDSWDDFEEIVIGLLGPRWRRQARLMQTADQVDTPKPLTPAPFEGTSAEPAASDEFESFAWGTPGAPETGGSAVAPPGPFTPPPSPAAPTPPEPEVGAPTPPPGPAAPPPAADTPAEAPPAPATADEEPVADSGFVTFGAPAPPPPTDALVPPPAAPAEPVEAEPRHETVPRADDDAPPVDAPPADVATSADSAAPPVDSPGADVAPPVDSAGADVAPPVDSPGAAVAPPVDTPGAGVAPPVDTPGAGVAPPVDSPPADVAPPVDSPPADAPSSAPGFDTYIAPPPPRPPTDEPPAPEPEAAPPPAPPAPEPAPPAPAPEPVAAAAAPEIAPTVAPEALRDKPAPPPPAPPGEKRGFKAFPVVLVAGAVLAAVLGFVIGGSGGGDGGETGGGAPTVESTSASMKLKVPEGWTRLATAPAIPGLELEDPIAMAPSASGETVVFGNVPKAANNSTLLPTELITAAGEVPTGREAVSIGPGDLQAYRYENVELEGFDTPVTLFVAPTSEGVATLACVAGAEGVPNCNAIADTVELTSGEPFPVGPSADYADTLGAAAGNLAKATKKPLAALNRADTPSAQADAARDLRDAYRNAARRLKGLELSPADVTANARLVAALEATAAAYGQAASAADNNNKAGYRQATRALDKATQQTDAAVEGIRAAGYEIET